MPTFPVGQNSLDRAVGRIESKVDTLLDQSTAQEIRIRSLETSRSWVRGMWAAMAAAWGAIIYTFTQFSK
jgi:hypothetical protein